jgi:hypothetical protein
METFKKTQSLNNNLISKETEYNLSNFTLYLDYHLLTWLKTDFPEALILSKIFKKAALKKSFIPKIISKHCVWYYNQMR